MKNASLKSTSVVKVAAMKNVGGAVHPSCHLKLKHPLPFSVSSLHSSTNQGLVEKRLCNQDSHYENTDDFYYAKEAITCNHQINTSLSARIN